MIQDQTSHPAASVTEEHWQAIWHERERVSEELLQIAADIPGDGKQSLRALGNWFRTHDQYSSAKGRPDVMAVCLPLLNSLSDGPLTPADISRATRAGFLEIHRNRVNTRRWKGILLYPGLVFVGCLALFVMLSITIIPQFESMFDEFGIELPLVTNAVLGLAQIVRHWWLAGAAALLGLFALPALLNLLSKERRPVHLTWLDERLMSNRQRVAHWAWHLTLLIRSGMAQDEAVEVTGSPLAGASGGKPLGEQLRHFGFPLLAEAFDQRGQEGQLCYLTEAATYYRERSADVGDWWIYWLSSILLWGSWSLVVIVAAALYMPLYAIISGLTTFGF